VTITRAGVPLWARLLWQAYLHFEHGDLDAAWFWLERAAWAKQESCGSA
jgi:hypothetical protein